MKATFKRTPLGMALLIGLATLAQHEQALSADWAIACNLTNPGSAGVVGGSCDYATATAGDFDINGNMSVDGTSSLNGIGNSGNLTQTGSTSITGTTSINTTGSAATNIGNASSASRIAGSTVGVTGTSTSGAQSAVRIQGTVSGSNTSNTGVLITGDGRNGAAYDNTSGATPGWADVWISSSSGTAGIKVTDYGVQIISPPVSGNQVATNDFGNSTGTGTINNNIGSGGSTGGAVNNTIGQGSSGGGTVTNVIGAGGSAGSVTSNTFGSASAGGGTVLNQIGTGSGASTNDIGNANAGTTVTTTAGNSSMSMSQNNLSMSVAGSSSINMTSTSASIGTAGGGSYTSVTTPYVIGTSGPALLNGDAASRANLNGYQYVNRLQGDTLVDGNMYISGRLVYSSSTSATTQVTSGNSVLNGASQQTSGQMSIANIGASGAVTDANGKLTTGVVAQSTASLTLTNGVGNTHGLVVNESQAVLSGGTNSTSLILSDEGARFSNSANGAPVKVTGVADGTSDFDAVNFRQLRDVARGVASTVAMVNIPAIDSSKDFAFGVGLGNFQGQTAIAMGFAGRPARNVIGKISLGTVTGNQRTTTIGAGLGYSW